MISSTFGLPPAKPVTAGGPVKISGTSTKPGELTVGVLVPAPGTWRLFLQCSVGGRVLTAPFTLHVT